MVELQPDILANETYLIQMPPGSDMPFKVAAPLGGAVPFVCPEYADALGEVRAVTYPQDPHGRILQELCSLGGVTFDTVRYLEDARQENGGPAAEMARSARIARELGVISTQTHDIFEEMRTIAHVDGMFSFDCWGRFGDSITPIGVVKIALDNDFSTLCHPGSDQEKTLAELGVTHYCCQIDLEFVDGEPVVRTPDLHYGLGVLGEDGQFLQVAKACTDPDNVLIISRNEY